MTDPIADMLTRIRNAVRVERSHVEIPSSKIKTNIAAVLKREGYIWDYEVVEDKPQNLLRIQLKYGPNGERVIQHLQRVSSPGRRVFARVDQMPKVLQGLGISIVSTSHGVMSSREAKQKGVGGEVKLKVHEERATGLPRSPNTISRELSSSFHAKACYGQSGSLNSAPSPEDRCSKRASFYWSSMRGADSWDNHDF